MYVRLLKNSFNNKYICIKKEVEFSLFVSDIKLYKNTNFITMVTYYGNNEIILTGNILNDKIFYQLFRNNSHLCSFLDDYDDQLKIWVDSF